MAGVPPRFHGCVMTFPASVVDDLHFLRVMYDAKPLSPAQKIRVRSMVMSIVDRGSMFRFGGWAEHELEFFVEFLDDLHRLQ